MIILKIIHLLRGYVRLRAQGGFSERFLNLCSRRGVPLWEVESREGVLYANTTASGYKSIREPARRSGMRVRIDKKSGLPFFFYKHRRRCGLLAGAVSFLLILGMLSGMVWTVSVEGCETVHEDEICEVLASLGVSPGVRRAKIDIDAVESSALTLLPQISWLSVNFQGSAVIVEVRENIGTPPQLADSRPSNLVAAEDGQIVTIEVFSGTREQKPSAAVLKGELLIGGITQNKDGSVNFRRAEGYVTANTTHRVSSSFGDIAQAGSISGSSTRCTIFFFGLKIPLGLPGKSVEGCFREEKYLSLGGVKMPVGIIFDRSYSLDEHAETLSASARRLFALEEHFDTCAAKFKSMQILNQQTVLGETDSAATVSGVYSCLQNIGERKTIDIENTSE